MRARVRGSEAHSTHTAELLGRYILVPDAPKPAAGESARERQSQRRDSEAVGGRGFSLTWVLGTCDVGRRSESSAAGGCAGG